MNLFSFFLTSTLWLGLLCLCTTVEAQRKKPKYNDGPYITIETDKINLRWIENGKAKDSIVVIDQATEFNRPQLPIVDLQELQFTEDVSSHYTDVEKFVAISDIHGQHHLFLDLLKAHNVIDDDENWTYGAGHLVVVGDIFDRGDQVTETLWFLFSLEKQAALRGGKVHLLLGNHELMVMHGDVRYINAKYRYTTGIFNTPYPALFDHKTVLGQWLRSKHVSHTLNEVAFVHGGFSKKVLEREQSLEKINETFKKSIYQNSKIKKKTSDLSSLLYFDNGPLWYRGYANPAGFDAATADTILNLLNVNTIIVGHTSMPQIISLHGTKIILIDSSIKFGTNGEILIYENKQFYRGLLTGEKAPLDETGKSISPFQYVYDLGDTDLKIEIQTDIDSLIANKLEEPYQDARLLAYHNGEYNRTWDIRVRARGNMRKKLCYLPPLKIDFSKSTLSYLGFSEYDKLKVVLPCNNGKQYQQNLYKEFLVYKLYEVIDSLALHTRLIELTLTDKSNHKYSFKAFCVEDEKNFMSRTGCEIISADVGVVTSGAFEREELLRFALFQYMILNSDWSFYNRHNVEILKCPGALRTSVIPYDFDYSGIVNQPYAIPAKKLPISTVRESIFRCKNVTVEEMEMMSVFFNSRKKALLSVIRKAKYLSKKNRKKMINDILEFFKIVDNPAEWEKNLLGKK